MKTAKGRNHLMPYETRCPDCNKTVSHKSGYCREHRTMKCTRLGCENTFIQYGNKRYCTKCLDKLQRNPKVFEE